MSLFFFYNDCGLLSLNLHLKFVRSKSFNQPLIIFQELPEKNASSVTVNVWDYVEGNLKPVGQKEIPPNLISSGNPNRLDYEVSI